MSAMTHSAGIVTLVHHPQQKGKVMLTPKEKVQIIVESAVIAGLAGVAIGQSVSTIHHQMAEQQPTQQQQQAVDSENVARNQGQRR